MARWAILCRAASDQLLENAHPPLWPPSCIFRRVAALALPPSLRAQDARVSTPSSRLTTGQTPAAGDPAAGDGIFPELLAGLVAANGAAATSSDAAPGLDTPAGIETRLQGILAQGKAADAAAPAARRTPAARRAGSPESSETDAGQLQLSLAVVAALENLPAPTSSAKSPTPSQAADGQFDATGRTTGVGLEVEFGSPGQSVPAGDQTNGQTASAAAEPGPLEAAMGGEPVSPPEVAGGGQPFNLPLALREATGNPAGTEVDSAPPSPLPAAGAALLPAVSATDKQPGELTGVQSKPADPATAQAALPLSTNPHGDVPADEMAVRAGLPTPTSGATAGLSDLSGRRTARTQAATPPSRRSSGSVVAQVLALSGQVGRTVDSIPPAAPAPQPVPLYRAADLLPAASRPAPEPHAPTVPADTAPLSPAESLNPGRDTQVRVLGTGTPDRDEVAFALQVKAMPTSEGSAQQASPAGLPAAESSERVTLAQQGDVPVPDPAAASQKRAFPPDEPDHAPARAARERRPDAASTERLGLETGATAEKMSPQASPDAPVRMETAPERPRATEAADAKPVRPQDLMDGAAKPDAAKAPGVRDMKFEVTGGQQRVEVRLSERAGEVKMTVRTADEPLANTLRENLPALSARLAESGFKSEAWHPAASSTDELRHAAESGARGASHDTNKDADAQPRQQDREPSDGAAQRRPKSPQESAPQKEKGKDFSWLISSLR